MVARYYLEETWKPSGEKTFAVLSAVDVPMARSWERFEFMQYVREQQSRVCKTRAYGETISAFFGLRNDLNNISMKWSDMKILSVCTKMIVKFKWPLLSYQRRNFSDDYVALISDTLGLKLVGLRV